MKKTLIYELDKHDIYYIENANWSFYILIPKKEYNETNISLRFKSNCEMYDLNKNSSDTVIKELLNYYGNLDNYNITLILPIFYNDILNRIKMVEDKESYQMIEKYLGEIFNVSYNILQSNNIKVNNNIYIINNDTFKSFTNWFVARYNNRIEYKSIIELVRQNGSYNSYDVIETPNINFIVGKNDEPKLENTAEMEVETFNSYNDTSNSNITEKEEENRSSGFVSYFLLGIIAFIVSIALLYTFVK